MSFSTLGLSAPLLKAIEEQGYSEPTPIQAQSIPVVIQGKDIMAAAQTGTGKTASFVLPILENLSKGPKVKSNQVRALVLTPTRELAAQVQDNAHQYSRHTRLNTQVVFGGVKINPQMMALRKGVDILVATPGRLLDLFQQKAVRFDQLEVLVLDEADRMLDMGFIRDIKKILAVLPKKRQNLLFSATFSDEIRELAKGLVSDPVEVSVSPRNTTAETVKQSIYITDKRKKAPLLVSLIKQHNWKQVLIFARTKHGANRLSAHLEKQGITSAPIHGNKSQGARTKALAGFKNGEIQALVATDIAARGIDIAHLPFVVNFDLPHVAEDYVHRIGRTGRAGAVGEAVSLVCNDETKELFAIERLTKALLPRIEHPDFTAVNPVPESRLDNRAAKAKKPKKPKKPMGNSAVKKDEHNDGQRSGAARRGNKPISKNPRHKRVRKAAGDNQGNAQASAKTHN